MSSTLQNILVLLGVVLIAGLGYYLFAQNSDLDTSGANNRAVTSQATVETEAFLRRLNELKGIELDGSILNDSRFTSLIDFSTEVQSMPVGRGNPFQLSN